MIGARTCRNRIFEFTFAFIFARYFLYFLLPMRLKNQKIPREIVGGTKIHMFINFLPPFVCHKLLFLMQKLVCVVSCAKFQRLLEFTPNCKSLRFGGFITIRVVSVLNQKPSKRQHSSDINYGTQIQDIYYIIKIEIRRRPEKALVHLWRGPPVRPRVFQAVGCWWMVRQGS